jgi:hypothetical protein
MTTKEYKKYLKSELSHSGFHDGWVIAGLKKELKKLEESENAKESDSQ